MIIGGVIIDFEPVLIGLGLLFFLAACWLLRKKLPEYLFPPRPAAPREELPDWKPVEEAAPLATEAPSAPVKGYYEMEETPPGVRPQDLVRTAKVTYSKNFDLLR